MRRFLAVACCLSLSACSSDQVTVGSPTPAPSFDARYEWSFEGRENSGMGEGSGLPTPRTEVAVASSGDPVVYVAGGFTEDGEATDIIERLDAAEGEWGASISLPEAIHHAALVSCRGGLYLIGGYTSDDVPSEKVWQLTFSTSPTGDELAKWRSRPALPTRRGAHSAACIDRRIHVVGGATMFGSQAQLVDAHEVFDVVTNRWSSAPPLSVPRDHLAATSDGKRLFVGGGRELSLDTNSARFDIYDPATDRWERGPDMPTPRGGLAAAMIGDDVLFVGGEEPDGTIPAAEVYLIAEDRWVRAPDMPTPRHGLGAATVYEDAVYVVGGGPEPGLSVSGAAEVLSDR